MAFQAQLVSSNSVPTYDLTSDTPGVTIVLNSAPTSRALTTRIPLNDVLAAPQPSVAPPLSTLQQRFIKSLPDPLVSPVVNPSNSFGSGADISSFEDDDGTTDDGIGSVPAEERIHNPETGNVRASQHTATYYRMPFNCPTLPTVPYAAVGDSTAPAQTSHAEPSIRNREAVDRRRDLSPMMDMALLPPGSILQTG
ncbi:hypothetical protein FRC17_002790, partial [Serendipita sp. 399]